MATRKKSRSTRSTTDGAKKRSGEDETVRRKKNSSNDAQNATVSKSSSRSTVSGPTHRGGSSETASDGLALKFASTQKLVAEMPYNVNKALEYGDLSRQPPQGQTATSRRFVSDREHVNRNQSIE